MACCPSTCYGTRPQAVTVLVLGAVEPRRLKLPKSTVCLSAEQAKDLFPKLLLGIPHRHVVCEKVVVYAWVIL